MRQYLEWGMGLLTNGTKCVTLALCIDFIQKAVKMSKNVVFIQQNFLRVKSLTIVVVACVMH